MTKRIFQWMLVGALLVAPFAATGSAAAWGGCASYAVVQWGDTLSSLAALCGTTVGAIQVREPGPGLVAFGRAGFVHPDWRKYIRIRLPGTGRG